LSSYDFGTIFHVDWISAGLIHATFKIDSERGRFILQKLHPVLSSEAITEDFFAVTDFLQTKDFPCPVGVRTKTGALLADENGEKWRLQTLVPGHTHYVMANATFAKESGAIFGRLHADFADFDYQFKSDFSLHDTAYEINRLKRVVDDRRYLDMLRFVRPEIDTILESLPPLLPDKSLPLRAVHGDPKISNIMFFEDGRASAVIDMDTCGRRPLMTELGDAFRSWCGGGEDDPNNRFNMEYFRASWGSYREAAGEFLTDKEVRSVFDGICLISLELATRFLTDYFEDSYFGWDSHRYASRRAHNLARAKGQIALFRDAVKKKGEIEDVIYGS